MFKLFGLLTMPISLALKLIRLPLTIMSCVIKLGCMLLILGIPAVIIALIIYLD